jgi:S1-C subfamily serine protease
MNCRRLSLLLSLSLCASVVKAEATSAMLDEARKTEQALSATIQRFEQAYVFIGGGSGVLISDDGLMLTNDHVAKSSKRWLVRNGTKNYTADVLGIDPGGDITLLKLKDAKNMPYVEFADSDSLVVGQQVIAIGNPFNTADGVGGILEPTVTEGIISALHIFQGNYTDAIQTDAAINPGNSGGPLLTLDGKLAGINGQIATRFGAKANTGIGLAIPAKQIQLFLPQLKTANGGRVYHGIIRGLDGNMEDAVGVRNGAEIKEVRAGSTAEKLGLQKGDLITAIDGYKLIDFSRFHGVLGTYPGGSEIKMTLLRGSEKRTVNAKLEMDNPISLGIELPFTGPQNSVVVDAVYPKLAGEQAGLKAGDEIVEIDGKPTPNWAAWLKGNLLVDAAVGDKILVKVRRGEGSKIEELPLTLTLGSRFDDPPPSPPSPSRPPRQRRRSQQQQQPAQPDAPKKDGDGKG